jgi:hypothetical protein
VSNDNRQVTMPWHLWIVGVLSLHWNGMGAFGYVMTESRSAYCMSSSTTEQLSCFYGLPMWAVTTWALSMWAGGLGSVLRLLRRRWALTVFGAATAKGKRIES